MRTLEVAVFLRPIALDNPTIVVLTDRNDLDDQLYETFTNCQQLLRQEPQQAEDRRHLRTLLSVASGGIKWRRKKLTRL